jgi:hypothetical protein
MDRPYLVWPLATIALPVISLDQPRIDPRHKIVFGALDAAKFVVHSSCRFAVPSP